MKKYILNLLDKSGCIRTGYEHELTGATKDEVITEYLHYILAHEDEAVTEDDINCVEVDWE